MMSQLHTMQQRIWNDLRKSSSHSTSAYLLSMDEKLTQVERLNIYRSTMRTAHTDALSNTYTCCEKILGEKYFKQIANNFFVKYPATNQNLNLYGQSFPAFLQDWVATHDELSDYQYLPDLAKLEQALEQSYFAKDDPRFNFASLQTLSEDKYLDSHFELSPSLAILSSNYPIYEIWLANSKTNASHEIQAIPESQYLCITREDYKPVIHKIDHLRWWILNKITNNLSLGEIEVTAKHENINLSLQTIIPDLIHNKWICSYR